MNNFVRKKVFYDKICSLRLVEMYVCDQYPKRKQNQTWVFHLATRNPSLEPLVHDDYFVC